MGLRLSAGNLSSKWGFDDGGYPQEVFDRAAWGTWGGPRDDRARDVWQYVLDGMVRELLIPALGVEVVLPDWGGEDSMHNPCEAESIDGVPLQDVDGHRVEQDRNWYETLKPEFVVVPWPVVFERLEAAMADLSVRPDRAGVV